MSKSACRPGRILCVEGPSAVGKTALATALGRAAGAVVIPELDASGAPPPPESAAWFAERSAARWARARDEAAGAPLVVLDGDPFKGLWYNPVYADQGWPGIDVVAPIYRAQVARGALAFPDLYLVLDATEAQLRERRAADRTRTRRNFESHLRLVEPQRRYFAALHDAAAARVLLLDTADRDTLVSSVLASLERLPPGPPDAARLIEHAVAAAGVAAA